MRYKIGEFAAKLNVHIDTLRRWDSSGKLVAQRSVGGTRYYTDEHFQKALRLELEQKPKRDVIYCRVSSPNQKDNLQVQIQAMETFALGRGLVTETITEIGGGMNFSRKKFMKLITDIISGDVGRVIVVHKDRLTRFGFEMIDNLAKQYGCEIIVVNREELSPQQEMIEDLMTIIHTFSYRLYGLRKYKKAKDVLGDETCT